MSTFLWEVTVHRIAPSSTNQTQPKDEVRVGGAPGVARHPRVSIAGLSI